MKCHECERIVPSWESCYVINIGTQMRPRRINLCTGCFNAQKDEITRT